MKAILNAFLGSEFSRPLRPEVFEWRLTHGMASWLLDGLDEVIAQDAGFFEYLFDLITRPEGQPPRMLLCVRDSLLATNDDFRDFCDEAEEYVAVYELAQWDRHCQQLYAELRFHDRSDAFMTLVDEQPVRGQLAATPYYAQLLADQFESGQLDVLQSEEDLLDASLLAIIEREYRKGLLEKRVVSPEAVRDFAEAVAGLDLEGGFRGVPATEAMELAEIVVVSTEEDSSAEGSIGGLTQLALFSQAGLGQLQFAQEILEHYLIGSYLAQLLNRPDVLTGAMNTRQVPVDWITLRVVAKNVRETGRFGALVSAMYGSGVRPIGFKNLLQTAILAAPSPTALKEVSLERRDLAGTRFANLDLSGVSFRGTDLSDAVFEACSLAGATLEDATLSNTNFQAIPDGGLLGTRFGDLTRFHSVFMNGRRLDTPSQMMAFLTTSTGEKHAVVEPCAAALQLRHLFNKFVKPDGSGRRDWHSRKALVSGKRHADPAKTVDAAIRYGYLIPDEGRDRILRPDGREYSDMIGFATSLNLPPGVRALLDDLCSVKDCQHVPAVASM